MNKDEKVIRTNDRCEECGGFLVFEVMDFSKSKSGCKIHYGVWRCAACGGEASGLWTGVERSMRHGADVLEGIREIRELLDTDSGHKRFARRLRRRKTRKTQGTK